MGRKKKRPAFDYDQFEKEAIQKLRDGRGLTGEGGALTGLIKRILEAAMDEELSQELLATEGNRRNGYTSKNVVTGLGEIPINPPRDRDGTFDPALLPKWQRRLAPEIERQILTLYSIGNSYQDIQTHLQKLYGVRYSTGQLSAITDRVHEEISQWRSRPLNSIYTFVYLDAIHYKVREDGKVKTKAIYTVLGVDLEGYRDVLGLYIDQAEGAKYWARVLEDLNSRGVEDVLFFCVDGLKGFTEAIEAIYPEAIIQRCIVHMVRTCLQFVSYKDYKAICRDMRVFYSASDEPAAREALTAFGKKWDHKYPEIRKKWEDNWVELSACFDYPEPVRRVVYTTNAVEALHRHLRKATKTKGAFVSDGALIKQLYLTLEYNRKSWARRVRAWPAVHRTLYREFETRIDKWAI